MLDKIIEKNRTYRRFTQEPLDCQLIKQIVENLRYIPSAKNAQALKYVISCNAKKNEEIFTTLKWAGYLTDWDGPSEGERPSAYIVILKDKSIGDDNFVLTDAGIAIQTILLQSVELNLGGCTIAAIDKPRLKSILAFPDSLEILYVMAIGRPVETVKIVDFEGSVKYYRKDGIHYVPKRTVTELVYKVIE